LSFWKEIDGKQGREVMLTRFFSLILVILICTLNALAQQPRGLQVSDLATLKDVSDAQISPDGKQIVFTVNEVSADHSRMFSRLWLVSTQGGEVRRLTKDEADESAPRWSPDGKLIAFYSNRDKQSGLWVASLAGVEPRLAAHIYRTNFYLTHAGESFTWSPDSKRLAFLSSPEVLSDTARVADNLSREGKGPDNYDLSIVPEQVRRH
jgi:Tol biopolymer transport system component